MVCGLASTRTLFSMADLRRGLLRPDPHDRLHVDTRKKGTSVVRTGYGADTSTLSGCLLASFSGTDHDVADFPQKLRAKKVV